MFSLGDVIAISCVTSFVTTFVIMVLMSALAMSGAEERNEEAYRYGFKKGREAGLTCPFRTGNGKECDMKCEYYHTCTRSEYRKKESKEDGRCKVDKDNDRCVR